MPLKRIAIVGAHGAIGSALLHQLQTQPGMQLLTFSRQSIIHEHPVHSHFTLDDYITSGEAIASIFANHQPIDAVIVTTGLLHQADLKPEKSILQLDPEHLATVYAANTIVPAMMARAYFASLNRQHHGIFAALSARVGSISDNRLGGWASYRCAKAALNMLIKTIAIETRRTHPNAWVVGLHPGTVDSPLSRPYSQHTPKERIRSPKTAALDLYNLLTQLQSHHHGQCIAYDGQIIPP